MTINHQVLGSSPRWGAFININTMEKELKEIIDLDVIAWRDDISKLINDIKQHKQCRFTSLVITKLEEAQMWAGNLFSVGKRDGIIKRK